MARKKKARHFLNSRLSMYHLGWLMGLEPTTTGITILGINQAFMRVTAWFVGIFDYFSPTNSLGLQAFIPANCKPECASVERKWNG